MNNTARIQTNGATKKAKSQSKIKTQQTAEQVAATESRPAAMWPAILELEQARLQSNALLELLVDTLDYQATNGSWPQAEGNPIIAGVGQLVRMTQDRLTLAENLVSDAAKKMKSEASAAN